MGLGPLLVQGKALAGPRGATKLDDGCRDAAGGEGEVCVASWGYKELPLKERSNGTNDNIEGARLMSCIQMTEGDDT